MNFVIFKELFSMGQNCVLRVSCFGVEIQLEQNSYRKHFLIQAGHIYISRFVIKSELPFNSVYIGSLPKIICPKHCVCVSLVACVL